MENPATWTEAEHVVSRVLKEAWIDDGEFRCGLSVERQITDALRKAGLLNED